MILVWRRTHVWVQEGGLQVGVWVHARCSVSLGCHRSSATGIRKFAQCWVVCLVHRVAHSAKQWNTERKQKRTWQSMHFARYVPKRTRQNTHALGKGLDTCRLTEGLTTLPCLLEYITTRTRKKPWHLIVFPPLLSSVYEALGKAFSIFFVFPFAEVLICSSTRQEIVCWIPYT